MKATPQNTIADRIKYLLKQEGISTYEFCKQTDMLDRRPAFDRALTKGDPDNVSPIFINAVYKRYKDKISMFWLMTGDDDETVDKYIYKIQELEKEKLIVSDLLKTSYYDIKTIVEKCENKLKKKK